MQNKLSLSERETVFNFNDGEKTAYIFTYNDYLKRRLSKLAKECPEDVRLIETFNDDPPAVSYEIPKKWIKIRRPRVLSAEQKERAATLARENLAKRLTK